MAQKKEDRYQSAGDVEYALSDLVDIQSKEHAIKSLNIIFAGAKAGIGTTHVALGFSNFLTRNGCPTLYQEGYDTETCRNLVRILGAGKDDSGVYHKGCLHIRPYYGSSVRIPYRYFPIITKDIGASWQAQNQLPEGDCYVLVCGGKWWETDAVLRAVKKFNNGNRLILLWNYASDNVIPRLPADYRDIPCQNMPFFANPLKAGRKVDGCYRNLYEMIAGGGDAWEKRKKKHVWKRSCE